MHLQQHPVRYDISFTERPVETDPFASDTAWSEAGLAHVCRFRPESSDHRPVTTARLLYDRTALYGLFHVRDRYVRCVRTQFGEPVYKDSCVEFFVKPAGAAGYFNFEFNCGGAFLCSYITDPTRTPDGFAGYVRLTARDVKGVKTCASLPQRIEPEIATPIEWYLGFYIPLRVLSRFCDCRRPEPDTVWHGNFYKCGDETSHPHWASWSPVDALNFHLPGCFGEMRFC